MKVYECKACDYASVSDKYRCPGCGTGKLQEREVSSRGSVYSYTDIHIAPAEFVDIAPYTVVLIQLDESKAKVTARMDASAAIGDQAELDREQDGAFIYQKC